MEKVSLTNLQQFVQGLLAQLSVHDDRATLVVLSGDLGAGKTTFVQTLAKELGIQDSVQSPTYVLMKKYPIMRPPFSELVHIDAYRLNSADEFSALKPEQFLKKPNTLVCVEWPERVEGALPVPDATLQFSSKDVGEGERYIQLV